MNGLNGAKRLNGLNVFRGLIDETNRRFKKLAERKPTNSVKSGTIDGADWDLEIGGVADIVNERGSSPAVLFDSVKGYPKGYRVLVNSFGSTKRLGFESRHAAKFERDGIRLRVAPALEGLEAYPAAAGARRAGVGKYSARQGCQHSEIPDAALVRARRRQIYRHGQREYYPRSRRRLDQSRHGAGDDPRREYRRFLHRAGTPWADSPRQSVRPRRAVQGGDLRRT